MSGEKRSKVSRSEQLRVARWLAAGTGGAFLIGVGVALAVQPGTSPGVSLQVP